MAEMLHGAAGDGTLGNRVYCLARRVLGDEGMEVGRFITGKERFLHKSRKVAQRAPRREGVSLHMPEFQVQLVHWAR